jgi:hypothetical protein
MFRLSDELIKSAPQLVALIAGIVISCALGIRRQPSEDRFYNFPPPVTVEQVLVVGAPKIHTPNAFVYYTRDKGRIIAHRVFCDGLNNPVIVGPFNEPQTLREVSEAMEPPTPGAHPGDLTPAVLSGPRR